MSDLTLGQYIKSLRDKKGLTLDQASDLIGCSKSYLWEIEHDKSKPSLEIAAATAFCLKGDIESMALLALRGGVKEASHE